MIQLFGATSIADAVVRGTGLAMADLPAPRARARTAEASEMCVK